MARQISDEGQKVLSVIESKLGRSPSMEEIEAISQVLENKGLQNMATGNTARFALVFPENFVTDGGILKLPAKEDDFFESYPLEHLGVDQNIRAIYTAKYLFDDDDGLVPPLLGYSEVGSWVLFPIIRDLEDQHLDEMEHKAETIRSREDIWCVTGGEVSGTPDINKRENWGVYDGEVVLRDLGSVAVVEQKAPDLDIPRDPTWDFEDLDSRS